ncbi:MAG: NAD-dependent epimerase/dehydratase family protein [Promethearchaeota archaeon]
MKIGITGISSTLGRCLITKLVDDGNIEQIIGFDLKEMQGEIHKKIKFVKGDVRNLSNLRDSFKNVEVLIHLAFVVKNHIPKLETIYGINVNGTKNVFNVAAELGIKKIIYVSSVAAYGKNFSKTNYLNEQSSLLGKEMTDFYYPYTKALVEDFISDFEKKHPEINITIFRPNLIVGPHFLSDTDNLKFSLGQLNSKRRIYWRIGNKNLDNELTQYTDEDDLVTAMHYAISNTFPGVYNIAGEPFNIREILGDLGKHEKYISFWMARIFLNFKGFFSKKMKNNLKWIELLDANLIMDCRKLLNSKYPRNLKTSKEITLNSLSYLKEN